MATIVVGYVPKPEGEAALTRAIEEARLREARLVVVNSHRGGSGLTAGAGETEAELVAVRKQLEDSGVPFDLRQSARGLEPAEDLVTLAEETQADLIVIGLRRRTPVGKLILGSSAQRILLDAHCPVLAVKA